MKSLSLSLSFLVVFQLVLAAQQALPTQLTIVVLEGEGAINNIGQRVGKPPVVRIEDENHKPVAGAAVVFTLPTEGATGEFGKGSKNLMVMTDAQGQAAAQGLKMNRVPGKVPIHINASYRGLTARSNLTAFSEAGPGEKVSTGGGGGSGKLIVILAIVGAAAAGGAYYATHRGGTTAPTVDTPTITPIGLTPGTGSICAPSLCH